MIDPIDLRMNMYEMVEIVVWNRSLRSNSVGPLMASHRPCFIENHLIFKEVHPALSIPHQIIPAVRLCSQVK